MIVGVDLAIPDYLRLKSAYDLHNRERVTHKVERYSGLLDFIFYTSHNLQKI